MEERDAFLDAFAAAWGEPFSVHDRRVAHAAGDHTLAYLARCEHAIGLVDGPGIRALGAVHAAERRPHQ